jgi:hypothetical protein
MYKYCSKAFHIKSREYDSEYYGYLPFQPPATTAFYFEGVALAALLPKPYAALKLALCA